MLASVQHSAKCTPSMPSTGREGGRERKKLDTSSYETEKRSLKMASHLISTSFNDLDISKIFKSELLNQD